MKRTMRRSAVVLRSKIEELYANYHSNDKERWDKFKACIIVALESALVVEVKLKEEIRELFLTLWDGASGSCSVQQRSLWSDVQLELQTCGIY